MALGNITKKKTTEAKALVNKTVSMSETDWLIMQNHLMLLSENVGKIGLQSNEVGVIYGNCHYFFNTIKTQINGKQTNSNS